MELKIYLSTSLSSWNETFSNGLPFQEIISKPSISLRKTLKAGTLQGNSLKINVEGLTSYCMEFIGYRYIRFVRDGNTTFIGAMQSFNRKIETADSSSYSITYKDLSEDWKDVKFCDDAFNAYKDGDGNAKDIGNVMDKPSWLFILEAEKTRFYNFWQTSGFTFAYDKYVEVSQQIADIESGLGSGEYVWSWECVESAGYKVCDPSNPSKSLVHKIMSYLPHHSSLRIDSIARDTVVKAFGIEGDDKVLEVLLKVCEQNSLGMIIDGLNVRFYDMYQQSGTAGTVRRIERDATLTDKPYIDKSQPDVRWCSSVDEVNYNHGLASSYLFSNKIVDRLRGGASYPNEGNYVELNFNPTIPPNAEVLTTNVTAFGTYVNKRFFGIFTDPFGNAFPSVISFKSFKTKALAKVKNKHEYVAFDEWGCYAEGSVTYVAYSQVVKSINSNGKEETCKYIYSAEDARRYDAVRCWQKGADSRYYTFYADEDLALGDLITLQNIDSNALIVISKTDTLDCFGGYTYTATEVIDRTKVSFDENYSAPNYTIPSNIDFTLMASRSSIDCYPNGTPTDLSPVRITVSCASSIASPSLSIDNINVNLTQDTVTLTEDGVTYNTPSNTWHYDLNPNLDGKVSVLAVATEGNMSKSVRISKKAGSFFDVSYAKNTDPDNPPMDELAWGSDGLAWGVDGIVWNDGTYTSEIPKVEDGEYLWMRFRTAESQSWQYTRLTGVRGDDGKVLILTAEETALRKNRYINDDGSITLHVTCRGYDEEPQLTYTVDGVTSPMSINDDGTAIYDYVISEAQPVTFTLTCEDDNVVLKLDVYEEQTHYWGVLGSEPENPTVGDSYVDENDAFAVKVFVNGGWYTLSQSGISDADVSIICSKAQKDVLSRIEAGTVTATDYGYFNTIIAGVVTADFISGIDGEFDNLRIGNKSQFFGDMDCPSFSSLPRTNPVNPQTYTLPSTAKEQALILSALDLSQLKACTHSGNSRINFIQASGNGDTKYSCSFYDGDMQKVGSIGWTYNPYTGKQYSSSFNYAFTLTIGTASDVIFKLKNIGSYASYLQQGELYYTVDSSGTTGTLHIKL